MRIFRVLLLLMLTAPAMAQITPRLFEYGPKLGVNLSTVSPLDTFTYSKSPGFGLQGGVFGRLNVDKFSLQTELIYQAKGANLKSPIAQKHTYRYISTPIIVGFTPVKQIYLELGYEKSWAINTYDPERTRTTYGPGITGDQSLIAGVRVNLLDAFSLFSVNVRYVHGLDNVTTLKTLNVPHAFENRSLQVSATYTFSEQVNWNKKFGKKK